MSKKIQVRANDGVSSTVERFASFSFARRDEDRAARQTTLVRVSGGFDPVVTKLGTVRRRSTPPSNQPRIFPEASRWLPTAFDSSRDIRAACDLTSFGRSTRADGDPATVRFLRRSYHVLRALGWSRALWWR